MDIKRLGLMTATAAVGFTLWIKWNNQQQTHITAPHTVHMTSHVDSSQHGGGAIPLVTSKPNQKSSTVKSPIEVKTDVLNLTIDPMSATISSAHLLKYSKSVANKAPISILTAPSSSSNQTYMLTNQLYQNSKPMNMVYHASQQIYKMKPGDKELVVNLQASQNGVVVNKQFVFNRGNYAVKVNTTVKNQNKSSLKLQQGYGIVRTEPKADHLHFNGASYSAGSEDYTKLSYSDIAKSNLNINTNNGWLAMQQHYFLSTWIPPQQQSQQFYTSVTNTDGKLYKIGSLLSFSLDPQQTFDRSATFYVGPENTTVLAALAPHLDRTVNYGWFSSISSFIFMLMTHIHHVVGNWGWTIVLITLLIKLVLYYPSAKSYRSMARMREVQPKVKILQERYKDDRQTLSQEMMKLYKKERVNPLGGCLPLLVQFPILIALYHLLGAAVELRQAPFIFWIHDLSVKDPFYILPILMGLSMFAQQKLNPAPPDPTQARVMMFLPVVMTVFFLNFAAGLTLYWLTNNILSFAQQAYIMSQYDSKAEDKKLRYKKKAKRRLG